MSDKNPLEQDDTKQFIELPMTILQLPVIGNFPVAGGLFLQMLPHYLLRIGIQKFNKAGFPAVFYLHPKELDPTLPRIPLYRVF
jgi:peptidoglycan-N-acetylglucosamine deacetylase